MEKINLDENNYYSHDANIEYMSVSQYKDFVGTYGREGCEYAALKKLRGDWDEKPNSAMLLGSYVDSYFEGSLDDFKLRNPDIFLKNGGLKAEFRKAEDVIARIERDDYFMKYMAGEKQVIMTGEVFGLPWKIKMDSYIPKVAIVDLKVMKSLTEQKFVKDIGYLDFIRTWGYDIQGAIYQEVVRQNTGEKLPFYIAGASKEYEPDIRIIQVTQGYLDEAMYGVEANIKRVIGVKDGIIPPDRCEHCDCCRSSRILTAPISIEELASAF